MSLFSHLSSLFIPSNKRKGDDSNISTLDSSVSKSQKKKKTEISKEQLAKIEQQAQAKIKEAELTSKAIIQEAKAKAKEIIVEAKDKALEIYAKADREMRTQEMEFMKKQVVLDKKLEKVKQQILELKIKDKTLGERLQELEKAKKEIKEKKQQILQKLEEVSKYSIDEAKKELFEALEKSLNKDIAKFIRSKREQAKAEADEQVKEILVNAMKYAATDYVAEYTVSVVKLPSEEVKGKIIGKSGRNIHTFERLTGVDLDLDVGPTEVRLSSFDPVRREIAKIALERLIKDGRIQPARIEEQVEKAKREVDKMVFQAGKQLCQEVGAYNLPIGLVKLLGRFKYRFSYGQNMITHTIEETKLGVKLAHELGLDVEVVRLGCLLHDIGKVSDEVEGNHVELGVKIAKKYGMPQSVIDCIAQHHEDEPFTGPEQMVVYIADAISGARPGARYENHEEYVKRLKSMEEIALQYPQVKEAYAIQAGRILRVLLKPEKSKDDEVERLALEIQKKISDNVIIPGTLEVTVIREVRANSKQLANRN